MEAVHKSAEQDYLSGMKYKDIAKKYGVTINTVKSWKQRQGWNRTGGAHSNKSVHTKRTGAPDGNRNAAGNRGGAAPKGNSNAVTHGFFRKHLPADALAIAEGLTMRSPIDILWENIVIQYTAIVRAQQIMYVKDRDDKTIERVEYKDGNVIGEKWEVQQAWDKQATFLQAQSRAMATLQGLIRQYDELCRSDLATEEQRLRLQKLQAEVKALTNDDDKTQDDGFIEALRGKAAEVWNTENTETDDSENES
ncbi:phage terminase small subunit [Cohnella algarum]|uniref:phage terminase small subunit n=1 Tax=Cohnella algarum TaxID=2044859 RepID=UPI001967CBB0|nr:phage terminase small subunit [Cohnella algarum]MBN2980132.1 hypothetical protein [Cohnella algarum]